MLDFTCSMALLRSSPVMFAELCLAKNDTNSLHPIASDRLVSGSTPLKLDQKPQISSSIPRRTISSTRLSKERRSVTRSIRVQTTNTDRLSKRSSALRCAKISEGFWPVLLWISIIRFIRRVSFGWYLDAISASIALRRSHNCSSTSLPSPSPSELEMLLSCTRELEKSSAWM